MLLAIAQILVPSGVLAELPGGALSRAAAFVGTIRDNGCRMTTGEADSRLAPMGFTPEETRAYARIMLDAGVATVDAEGGTLVLSQALCAADPAVDRTIFSDLLSDAPDPVLEQVQAFGVQGVSALLWLRYRDAGCVIDVSDTEKAVADLTETVALDAGFPQEMSDAARAALKDLVGAFIASPGPRFAAEPGRLVAQDCTP
ncbi:MAG: hypothetical protein N2422_11570 [Rhodobacteraceae bacterium]|nr:hypothetical protein [Paracoccaceae bacterium]